MGVVVVKLGPVVDGRTSVVGVIVGPVTGRDWSYLPTLLASNQKTQATTLIMLLYYQIGQDNFSFICSSYYETHLM